MAIVGEPYEGASLRSRELALWHPPLRSADADILDNRDAATGRARDMMRNDAYAHAGEILHRDGVVGAMFLLNAKPDTEALGIKDEKWEEEFQEEVESKFTLWAESLDNWPDASRMNTLTGLVRLAVGVYLASGEVLATAEWDRDNSRPYNTCIQMIEGERLGNPMWQVNDQNVRAGVRRNKYGAPQSYFIRNSHPSDLSTGPDSWKWTEYPARLRTGRTRVIHLFEQARVDQTRGISELVHALKEMKTTKQFREIQLENAVVNATFAASIEADLPSQAYAALGGGDDEDLISYAQDYLGAVGEYSGGAKSLTMNGVRIPHLFPGQKLQLRPAGAGGGINTEFEASLIRYIAADLGVSYEELSRDYSHANYSSMRAGTVQTGRFMLSRKKMVADRFGSHIYRLWFEEMIIKGQLETMKGRPDFYEGLNRDAFTKCDWLGASRGQIDELKETQAAAMRVEKNLGTLEDELGKLGKDWRAVLKQLAREKKAIDALGLTPIDPNAQKNMDNATTGKAKDPKQPKDE